MSVDWDRVKEGLVAFSESTRAVEPGRVFWEREAQPIVFDTVLLLRISAERAHGFDDVEMVPQGAGPTGGRLTPRVTGIREFVCSFRISSRSQASTAARIGLERVRSSLHHPGRQEILLDHGVGFLSTEPIVTFDEVQHDRWESLAVLDVRFTVRSELYDADEDSDALETLHAVEVDTRAPDPVDPTTPTLITEPNA